MVESTSTYGCLMVLIHSAIWDQEIAKCQGELFVNDGPSMSILPLRTSLVSPEIAADADPGGGGRVTLVTC